MEIFSAETLRNAHNSNAPNARTQPNKPARDLARQEPITARFFPQIRESIRAGVPELLLRPVPLSSGNGLVISTGRVVAFNRGLWLADRKKGVSPLPLAGRHPASCRTRLAPSRARQKGCGQAHNSGIQGRLGNCLVSVGVSNLTGSLAETSAWLQ